MNYGDVPTWISDLITGVAVVAAFKVWRIERDRDEMRHHERRAAFANLVGCWPEVDGISVRNGGPIPIYNVVVTVTYSLDPASADAVFLEGQVRADLLPPGDSKFDYPAEVRQFGLALASLRQMDYEISFRDAHGLEWWRRSDGRLLATAELEPPRMAWWRQMLLPVTRRLPSRLERARIWLTRTRDTAG